ncbi:MAG: squalene synthase HpnC [Chloroflexi bacterium]|nr:squalene synthase HpnC [Chloroflexota bacterium]MYK60692.1 squalene synthase HpnC [Chloroflexota bacterium]
MNATKHLTAAVPDVGSAYKACRQLAADSYENFNVGSRFIKRRLRPHFYSVYAFCRLVDDLGDELEGDRLDLLDRWEDELALCYSGSPKLIWFQALQRTIDEFDIPPEPFLRLIEANRRDQRDKEYADFDALIEYCTYSATPVGHLVLYLYGYFSDEMASYSDDTCVALQLANFWQDVARDYEKGRIYIPISDMDEFGVGLASIRDQEPTSRFRQLMKFQVDRTRELFRTGYQLHDHLQRDFRLEFSAITAGGLSVLNAIEALDYDTLTVRPTVSRSTKIRIMLKIVGRNLIGMTPVPASAFISRSVR